MRGWVAVAHPFFVWTFLLLSTLSAQSYSSATIVNAATGQPILAPNTFASIYGKDFSLEPRALAAADIIGGDLPTTLPGTGVRVVVEGIAAPIWYVSPTQINFLIPPNLLPKRDAIVVVTVFGRSGPAVNINMAAESPGLFQADPETPVVMKRDGTMVSTSQPAAPGDEVLLFATGLGRTDPDATYRQVAREASPLTRRAEFRVLLNNAAVSDKYIRYAGAAPGFAGLYQINLIVPEDAGTNPRIQIALGDARSQPGLRLPVR